MESRFVIYSEDYDESELCFTNLSDAHLRLLLTRKLQNDEDGVGMDFEDILYDLQQEGIIEDGWDLFIDELCVIDDHESEYKTECIYSKEYGTFSKVLN